MRPGSRQAVPGGILATRSRARWWIAASLAVIVAAVAWSVRQRAAREPAPPSNASAVSETRTMELTGADLTVVGRGPLEVLVPLSGSLRPLEQTLVKSKVAGELRSVAVREGQAVQRGQVIARFDDVELQARVAEKRANREAARAQLELASKTWKMNADLLEQGFISQNAADNVRNSVLVGEANLKSAEAQLELAEKALSDAVVRAPLSGIVAERFAQPGEKLPVDARILSIVDLDRMELEAEVPGSDIAFVRVGQPVALAIEGFGGKTFQGRVDRIAPTADERSRAVKVYVVLPNPARELKGGMFAKGELRVRGEREAVLVALAALREERGETVVYRLDGDTVVRQPVRIGMRDTGRGLAEVLDGLAPGSRVLNANLVNVRPGDRVREAPGVPKA